MKETVQNPLRLINEREAATTLGISPRKLWELRRKGTIPHLRIDRCVRYDPRDLDHWISEQKTKARRA